MQTTSYTKIFLRKGKERSLIHFHPWLFSGAIEKKEREPAEGEVVEIYSQKKEYLATGHYFQGSIAVRIFSFKQLLADVDFWKKKIADAVTHRRNLGFFDSDNTNAFRLVHGEGDGMPGLIVDYYNGVAVMQAHTTGMHRIRETLAEGLKSAIGKDLLAIYDKSAETLGKEYASQNKNEFLFKTPSFTESGVWVKENSLSFFVNFEEGQKTGFFLDQRENRKLLREFSKGKKVLNTFAYSGGFSMYALAGGATLVHSVDSSAKASEWAGRNVEKNFPNAAHTFFTEDVFDFFKANREQYDVMVVDPPAFAKRLSAVRQACSGYQRLNEEAIKRIKPGGILFTFSCSQVVDRKLFRQVIFAAAAASKRNVVILHQLSQPADHPISLYHPEGEYLKGLVLRVD